MISSFYTAAYTNWSILLRHRHVQTQILYKKKNQDGSDYIIQLNGMIYVDDWKFLI